jgi:hypothetical protein
MSRIRWNLWWVGLLILGLVLTLPGSVLVAQEEQKATDDWVQPELPESFNAWAVSMGTHFTGANTSLLIKIDRWSTPEEREQILSSIIELGAPDNRRKLAEDQAKVLQKQKECGFIRSTSASPRAARRSFPSERLRYCWQWREEGSSRRRLVLALDRPLGFAEVIYGGRTLDYGMTIIVLDLDANQEGSGLLSMGTMVTFDNDTKRLTLENYSSEPVRLNNVRKSS